MAGSVFAHIGGMLVPSIVLAVPGFIGWIIPYLLYSKFYSKKSAQLELIISQKYDEIYEECEKANNLLTIIIERREFKEVPGALFLYNR